MNTHREIAGALACRVGHATVADNLAAAVAAGWLIAHDDGTWEFPVEPKIVPTLG